jgi:fucose 4-O-acetylase-like acetyltransferase
MKRTDSILAPTPGGPVADAFPESPRLAASRDHALDALRAFAMLLGIGIHGLLAYTTEPVPFWCAHDVKTSILADLYIFTVHDFRMQLFFLLSGYFAALTAGRRGVVALLKHRFVRVGVPLFVGLLTIQPLVQLMWLYGDEKALAVVSADLGYAFDAGRTTAQMIDQHFLTGEFLKYITPFHMWFLYYLLYFFAAAALWTALTQTLVPEARRDAVADWAGRQWRSGGRRSG